jgi:hypothetical protein
MRKPQPLATDVAGIHAEWTLSLSMKKDRFNCEESCANPNPWWLILQGSMLSGHKLSLQLSMKRDIGTAAAATKKAGKDKNAKATKVVVRNVAFEATVKEIRALFQPFGQIKSVRLPRKFDNSHRYHLALLHLSQTPVLTNTTTGPTWQSRH